MIANGALQSVQRLRQRLWSSRAVWLAPLALMLLSLVLQCGDEAWRAWLRYDRAAIEAGQWWRLLSGNFVHLGWYHLMLNEIGLAVLVMLCPDRLSPWVWLRRVLVLGIGMSLCLYVFVPSMVWYVGLSGMLHGLFLLGLAPQLRRRDGIAIACMAYLLGKLAYENITGAPVSDAEAIGGRVAIESHFFGTLVALGYALTFRTFWGRESEST